MLKLPPVGTCLPLRDKIDHTFEFIVEQQPIGHKLFLLFCEKDLKLSRCMQFLHAVDELKIVVEGKRLAHAQTVFDDFLSLDSPQDQASKFLGAGKLECVSDELATKTQEKLKGIVPVDVFEECRQAVRDFLSGQPLIDFVESPFYWRFLQWKTLERMIITKDHFRQYRVLGKGGFGLVFACQSKFTGKMYALKKLEKKRVKKRKGEKLALNEKEVLEKVDSRFVVTLAYAYQSKDSLCMVLTLMNGGDLRFHIYSIGSPGLEPERVVFYAAEIACGLHHLHTARIAYRDMKPDNILLDDAGHIRISDLGLAVHIPEGQSVRGRVGTPGYMAPEVIDGHRYTFAPDWWGMGCLIYEMICGRTPFRKHKERVSREDIERRIKDDRVCLDNSAFTEDSRSICDQFLDKVHATRLGCCGEMFEDVKAHPFFQTIDFAHLEAGLIPPPFIPNSRAVYAKDVLDIDQFSSVRGVEIEKADEDFADKFATGIVPKPWQEEVSST
uniref:G protein-coupled receptor kinase n=1 Tax=Amphimedon queenslandica TaxID=400682 RepID=A0A1X7VEF9_AMPQE